MVTVILTVVLGWPKHSQTAAVWCFISTVESLKGNQLNFVFNSRTTDRKIIPKWRSNRFKCYCFIQLFKIM